MMSGEKVYLGDSVYAEMADRMVKLTTNNGDYDSNTIYLEPEVAQALIEYCAVQFGSQEETANENSTR
jgi:hypothetical protein